MTILIPVLLSLRTNKILILVLGPQVFVLGPQVLVSQSPQNCQGLHILLCMIMWSINSVTATVHEVTVKNGLLTDISYYLLICVWLLL